MKNGGAFGGGALTDFWCAHRGGGGGSRLGPTADDNSAEWDRGKREGSAAEMLPNAEPASNISRILPATLISPEVAEPVRRKLGVSDGVLDVLVAEIGLQRTRVDAVIRELVTAGMPEHVRMHWKVDFSDHTEPSDHLAESRRREWRSALGRENKRRR